MSRVVADAAWVDRQPSEDRPLRRRGTSPERIAPESLTLFLSEFVHGHILYCAPCPPQHPVKPPNRWVLPVKSRSSGPAERHHCVRAVALLGCATERNWVACITPSPIGVGTITRKATITRVPAMGASQSSM